MSTSPSWFDQDKFSRLVKKVGPKPAAGQAAPKAEPAPPPAAKAPNAAPSKAPATPPPRETRLTGSLPKISIGQSLISKPTPPIAPPIHSDAGLAPEEETNLTEEEVKKEEVSPLPEAVKRPPISAQRMMTSQALTLGKPRTSPLASPSAPPREEPIRAPETSETAPVRKAPPVPGAEKATPGMPTRTTSLPALKSLFQYEIPGGQAPPLPAKSVPEPPAPNLPPPSFTFPKLEAKAPIEVPPPALDEENDEPVPSLAGLAEAGHVDDLPEDLSAESLAADWGKNDELHDEIARLTKERDDALAEGDSLLRQLREIQESEKDKDTSAPSAEELATVTKERDQTRSEYIKLREEFENLKREKAPSKGKLSDSLPEVGKEVKKLREELAEKDRELHAVKTTTTGMDDAVETLKAEVNELKEQIKKAKDDAAVAQRGLALSQKALQETREALREASESAHPKPGLGSLGK